MSDLIRLLEARLWIARIGEMDVNRWWRTEGILGPDGAFVGPRVLPVTHPTARARIALAVARHACDERYPNPKAWHLFRMSPEVEDTVDAMLVERLGDRGYWSAMMAKLERVTSEVDPAKLLWDNEIVTSEDLDLVQKAAFGPAQRSLPLQRGAAADETVRRLAAGFVRSPAGSLAVPYVNGGK